MEQVKIRVGIFRLTGSAILSIQTVGSKPSGNRFGNLAVIHWA
jgi:hypothetical protein